MAVALISSTRRILIFTRITSPRDVTVRQLAARLGRLRNCPSLVENCCQLGRSRGRPSVTQLTLLVSACRHLVTVEPADLADLLHSLREAGARDHVTALPRRDPAAHTPLDHPADVAALLHSLREAGRRTRSPCWPADCQEAGIFGLFRELDDRQDRFRFGPGA